MRILFLTNFFPPYNLGGMGISCQDMVVGLKHRDHSTRVLTSIHGVNRRPYQDHVTRLLRLEMDLSPWRNAWELLLFQKTHETYNRKVLRDQIFTFNPDVVFIWGMWNLHRILAKDVEDLMEGRVLYRFADYWPTLPPQSIQYWNQPGKNTVTHTIKQILSRTVIPTRNEIDIELSFKHSYCVSKSVRNELVKLGIPIASAPIIYSGFDLAKFACVDFDHKRDVVSPHEMLYIGRLTREKGVHIAIAAIDELQSIDPDISWKLSIAGDGERSYVSQLKDSIRESELENRIKFLDRVPSNVVSSLLKNAGIVLIPSIWNDPLPRSAIEAMAAGCVVVASNIGGLPEIIHHEQTGLLHQPNDPVSLAQQIKKLGTTPGLPKTLAENARASALARFSLDRMLDQVEDLLYQTVELRSDNTDIDHHINERIIDHN